MKRWRDKDPHESGASGAVPGERAPSGRRRPGQQAVSFRARPQDGDGDSQEATQRAPRRPISPRGRAGTQIKIDQRTLILGGVAILVMLLLLLISRMFVSPATPAAAPTPEAAGPTAQPGVPAVPTQGAIQLTVVPIEPSYTIQPGDTLATIARRFNTSVDSLASINNITDRNAVKVGQKLVIP